MPYSACTAWPIDNREQIGERLPACASLRPVGAQCGERAIDRVVDRVPVGRRARLERRLRIVPRRFQILDARLRAGEVTLVDALRDVDGDRTERRQIAELRDGRGFGHARRDACRRHRADAERGERQRGRGGEGDELALDHDKPPRVELE
ncbi:hypothetical protein X989_5206 [Burkholderia pseudomallei MSHR4378]|nr:hypothetical protein X989_5206 [Burkholderia pseudomallei MSHR4378]